jgi:hypothetical protein
MKHTLSLIILFFSLFSYSQDSTKVGDEYLKGRVRSYSEVYFKYKKFGTEFKKTDFEHTSSSYQFNKNGKVVEEQEYYYGGKEKASKRVYKYDENGEEIEEVVFTGDGQISAKYLYKNTYSKEQLLIGYTVLPEGHYSKILYYSNSQARQITSYSSDGTIYRIRKFNFSGVINNYTEFYADGSLQSNNNYNEHGNIILEVDYNIDGTIFQRKVYEYDDFQNLIKRTEYNSAGDISHSWNNKLVFDNNQNIIDEKVIENSVLIYHYKSEYNVNREKIKSTKIDSNGKIMYEKNYSYKYDKNGRVIEKLIMNENNELTSKSVYKFDVYGNLIERKYLKMVNSELIPRSGQTWVIEYFE